MDALKVGDHVDFSGTYKKELEGYCRRVYSYDPLRHYMLVKEFIANNNHKYVNIAFVSRTTGLVVSETKKGGFEEHKLIKIPVNKKLIYTKEELICQKITYLWERQEYVRSKK